MDGIYSSMAKFYDSVNSSIDYAEWADFAEEMIKRYSDTECKLVLDAACGTGSMTLELAKRGYDMTALDLSSDMLCIARQRAEEVGLCEKILFLCQNVAEMELYGTVDACVCTLDSVNHITDDEDLCSFFDLLHRCYLMPGGILIFDVNTPHKFKTVYADNDFILEDEGMYCGWSNYHDEEEGLQHFCLSLFEQQEDGSYIRTDMQQTERIYQKDELCDMLSECGFEIMGIFSDYKCTEAKCDDERWYFVAKNKAK